MLDISLLKESSISDENSVITDGFRLEANTTDPIADRIKYSISWLKNNTVGPNSIAYNLGFAILPYQNEFEKILQWGSLTDNDDKPYGAFTVFGFDDSGNSYIDKFINNSITKEELAVFHHNWTQGTDKSNQISLKVSNIFEDNTYKKNRNLVSFNPNNPHPSTSESNGLVRVLFGVRLPDFETAAIGLKHKIFFEEEL